MKWLLASALVTITILLIYFSSNQPPEPLADNQWLLPGFLNEASGLAVVDDDTLLVHSDEAGIVYRVHLPERKIETLGVIGSPPVDEDMEGIAIDGRDIYLVNSTGTVFYIEDVDLAASGQQLEAERLVTGLAEICEIEGLAFDAGELLLPCKTPLGDQYLNQLVVFRFEPKERTVRLALQLNAESLPGVINPQPTAIDVTENAWWIISRHQLLKLERGSQAATVFPLQPAYHKQPEGLAMLAGGGLVIVDDHRRGVGRLAQYDSLDALSSSTAVRNP